MDCPNGWTECELCLYWLDKQCYCDKPAKEAPQEEKPKPIPITKSNKFWRWWAESSPPNIHEKDVLPPRGAILKRGGSKSVKRKKSAKGTKIYVDKWNGI